jgi:hypothetical protein
VPGPGCISEKISIIITSFWEVVIQVLHKVQGFYSCNSQSLLSDHRMQGAVRRLAPLEPSATCMHSHDKFSGTISDLKSRASFGCRGCSIVYDGLTTLNGPCSDFSNCTVDWESRGKATLAVLVRHRCNLKYNSGTPRVIEFIHNIGPFGT